MDWQAKQEKFHFVDLFLFKELRSSNSKRMCLEYNFKNPTMQCHLRYINLSIYEDGEQSERFWLKKT